MNPPLSPAQQNAYQGLFHALSVGNVLVLNGQAGSGRSTILRELHHTIDGKILTMHDFVDAMRSRHPLQMEEMLFQVMMDAFAHYDVVFVDDIELISAVVGGCSYYPRSNFLECVLTAVTAYVVGTHKKLVLASCHSVAIQSRSYQWGIGEFKVEDYQFFIRSHLGEAANGLDFDKIFRFAPKLNAHQLKGACLWLRREVPISTERMMDYLRSQYLASNVDLGEVQNIRLEDLKGVDDVIKSLEANIILPLENDELANEFQLKPKRGVLLAGPPGTGKTSVGRALAHRLQSKFFLLDGTFISGTSQFYYRIAELFESAKQNAPSIIFIDDCDAIFESGEEQGLYRYLLTMLDGLESASSGRVCVMLTAMDIAHLPPALIRSGRVELWLEMKLPDAVARQSIMEALLSKTPELREQIELDKLQAATDGFTGADLKRLIDDGKIMLAFDRSQNLPLKDTTTYFRQAADAVRENKKLYAEAEARARSQGKQRAVVKEKEWE
jgi:transitional endoplasmic reticulum ATPase